MNDLQLWQKRVAAQTEIILQQKLPQISQEPAVLHEAMRYSALDGGKRLRPLLVWAASQLGDSVQAACEAAMAAVECIHVYSLVHDDMPEMDNDQLRRGKPTCHVQFGDAVALLTGGILSAATELPAERQLKMVQVLAKASGSLGMAGGQAIDLANVGKDMKQPALEQMHGLKTGVLIRAAVQLGGLSCPQITDSQLARLDAYAAKLGLAFQVIDDVLDCEADTATLGKTAGKDADNNKPTYVKLMGLQAARKYAEQLVREAVDELAVFDERAQYLRQLAEYVVARNH